ncbi:MAG TPA: glycosyltransferase family 4 protein [Clostridia bacterium]|nr:glycosyltransferase family 4 protein [Clostridia bacterium]
MKITFLIPSNRPSGGIRVTMQMANCLIERGHDVRIAYRTTPLFSSGRVRATGKALKFLLQGLRETCWLDFFKGPQEEFVNLGELSFEKGEIVIATGVQTIPDLIDLAADVVKIRYCHGLFSTEPESVRKSWLWEGPMHTISVSPVMVPELERLSGRPVLGVVPNGIYNTEYYLEERVRDGVGLIYGQHPVKGPEVAQAVVKGLAREFEDVPCYVFGTSRRVASLSPCQYTRFPSVAMARELYNRSKVWLVTSRDEGFSLPILEAMACGCVVVSSRHSNAAQFIQDGINGFTVPYGDVSAYLRIVRDILENEPLRQRIVQEGFEVAQKFTWNAAADLMEEALQRALPRGNAARAVMA